MPMQWGRVRFVICARRRVSRGAPRNCVCLLILSFCHIAACSDPYWFLAAHVAMALDGAWVFNADLLTGGRHVGRSRCAAITTDV